MSCESSPSVAHFDGAVAWFRLNRPEAKNALNAALVEQLDAFIDQVEHSDDIHVVILTGTGDTFCAGADLKGVVAADGSVDATQLLRFVRQVSRVLSRLAAVRQPVIAAVNGLTLAGGLELVMHCDLVIASEQARLGDGHITYGLLPGAGGAARLSRLIGPTRSKYLAFTGATLPATDCQAMGLVNEVLPDSELEARAAELAGQLAAHSTSALRLFKQAIDDGLEQALPTALRLEHLALSEHLHSGHIDEGLTAFREKRAPEFDRSSAKEESS